MEFDRAIHALVDSGAEFVIIDGVSAILHGSATLTFDVDICYSRETGNLQKLVHALAPFHPRLRGLPAGLPFVWDKATLLNAAVLTLVTDLCDIDLLAEVAGMGDWAEIRKRSVRIDAFDRTVSILDLRSLINAKRAAGRPKDLAVLPELESLLEANEP